jgi:uncharacterized membrane protein YfhO
MEKYLKKNTFIIIVLFLASGFLVLVSVKFFVPGQYLQVDSNYYTNAYALQWSTSKISDEYMPKNFKRPNNQNEIASYLSLNSKIITVKNVSMKTQSIAFDIDASKAQDLIIPLAYFPSWQGYVDGKRIVVKDNNGKIEISVPNGQHKLMFIFKENRIELIADVISLAGILALFLGIIQLSKKYA